MKHIMYALLLTAVSGTLAAQETAREIISKSDEVRSTQSEILEMEMEVYDRYSDDSPDTSVRLISTENAEGDSIIVFSYPRSVNGMAILTKDEGQWVYFPSTGRVRKIGGSARSGSVQGVGGDFSYEDLGSGDWGDDYDFTLEETGSDGWILRGIPVADDISYSEIRMFISREDYLPRWIEFFRGEDTPEKKLTVEEIGEWDGVKMPSRMEMRNLRKQSRTVVIISGARINTPLDDVNFTQRKFYR